MTTRNAGADEAQTEIDGPNVISYTSYEAARAPVESILGDNLADFDIDAIMDLTTTVTYDRAGQATWEVVQLPEDEFNAILAVCDRTAVID